MAKPIHAPRAIHCTSVRRRDNKKCPTEVEHFLYTKILSKLYSCAAQALPLGATHNARILRAAAEQSALARLQASLQTRFV